MANINVGELIVVNQLPTQTELNNKSITVGGATKNFNFPVVFRKVGGGLSSSVDYTYRNAVDAPVSSFNPDLSLIQSLSIVNGELLGVSNILTAPSSVTSIVDGAFKFDPFSSTFSALIKVLMGDSVISIGYESFRGNKITDVVFGNGILSIGNYAFSENELTAATLPENCTYYVNSFDAGVVITGGILIT